MVTRTNDDPPWTGLDEVAGHLRVARAGLERVVPPRIPGGDQSQVSRKRWLLERLDAILQDVTMYTEGSP